MASVGALGIGLSVVFSVFLILLLAELYYLLFWKRKSLLSSSRVNSVAPERSRDLCDVDLAEENGGDGDDGVLKLFESRIIVGSDGECHLAPPRMLFTIKEETREDLDAHQPPPPQKPGHVILDVQSPTPPSTSPSPSPSSLSSSILRDSSSSLSSSMQPEIDTEVEAEADDDSSSAVFLTPPSSPGFSTPSQSPPTSPLRAMHISGAPLHRSSLSSGSSINARFSSCSSRSNLESPPLSPLLVPMPVITSATSLKQPQQQQPQPQPQPQRQRQTSLRMQELLTRNASSARNSK